jgi:hypothetical protein
MRSLELGDLDPLLTVPGVTWVSLQRGDCREEIEALRGRTGIRIHQLAPSDNDVENAAATICALDLVVTVCSSVVHLAGALGRPAWVLTPHVPAWRYLLSGDEMPWYPSITLLRQPSPGEWSPVIDVACRNLADVRR